MFFRIDCYPEVIPHPREVCEARGCCYDPVLEVNDNIPWCFYPSDYLSYKLAQSTVMHVMFLMVLFKSISTAFYIFYFLVGGRQEIFVIWDAVRTGLVTQECYFSDTEGCFYRQLVAYLLLLFSSAVNWRLRLFSQVHTSLNISI